MKFSLILSTLGRDTDLDQFFEALWEQSHQDVEVIVVGPLDNTHTIEYLRKWEGYPVKYAGAARGHSRAINIGLAQATGDIVAFPDDDCWYPQGLLESISRHMQSHPEWTGVSGRCMTSDGFVSNGRWDEVAGLIGRHNVWRRACSVSMFIRRADAAKFEFDETMGVGANTPWGGGEDPDFVLRLIEQRARVYYNPALVIHHPEWRASPYTEGVRKKAASYGRGFGRVLRKHHYSLAVVALHLARPLAGALISVLTGQIPKAQYHFAVLGGRFSGWTSAPDPTGQGELSKTRVLAKS